MSVTDYTWVRESNLGEAGCVTVVPGGDLAAVLTAFGAVGASARSASSFDDVEDMHAAVRAPICVVELPGAVVVLENNGFQGSRAEVLRPASRAGTSLTASSLFWNVNAVTAFSAARRGKMVFSVELVGAEHDDLDGVPKALRRHVVAADDHDVVAAGLDLVHRWTRTDFSGAAVLPGTVYDTDPPPSELTTYAPGSSHLGDVPGAPDLLAAMTPAQQRAVAAWATAVAAHEAGIADEPAVASALRQLADTGRCSESPAIHALDQAASARLELFSRLWDLQDMGQDLPLHPFHEVVVDSGWGPQRVIGDLERLHLAQEARACRALRYAAHPDAYSAAVACLDDASSVFACGRTDRGWTFTEGARGRRRTGVTDNPRHVAFVRTAHRFLRELPADPAGAASRASADLPRPLSRGEKEAAVRADLEAAVRGDFAEWQGG